MRKVTFALLFLAACGIDVRGRALPTTTTTNPTDPVKDAGTSASDASGADDDATVGVSCNDGVLTFDGTDDFVTIAQSDALELHGDFTVEAWIRPSARTTEMDIVSHHDTNGSAGWALRLASGRAEIVVWGNDMIQGDMGFAAGNAGASYVVPGKWAYVAGTMKGGTLRIYYDGTLRDSQDVSSFFGRYDFGGPVVVGRSASGDPFAFEGDIDDVRLSKDARYTGNTAAKPVAPFPNDASTIAMWSFDEVGTNTVVDVSTHGHDGLLGSGSSAPNRTLAPCVSAR